MTRRKIVTGRCYRTTSGELCRVVQITDDGDVVFVSLTVDRGPRPEIERMDGSFFADAVVGEEPIPLN